jgi:alanyl-tRNA synthetase
MVPFKKYFTGEDHPPHTRVTTSQKCLRISGKHNDLDEVGQSNRHHTFFKMLGNFSFGDYGREEAIAYAWEFLTKTLKLRAEDLIVTYYPSDTETRTIWQKILPDNNLREDPENWWSMGYQVGPCGPCTEIYFHELEIWNVVLMTHRYRGDGLEPLQQMCVDTGMGLERLLSVVEQKESTWDTSIFQKYYELLGATTLTHKRILADHARAVGHLLEEGALPGNKAQGYTVRRLIRRAVVFCSLDEEETDPEIFGNLCGIVTSKTDIVRNEIQQFQKVLRRGLPRLKREIKSGRLTPEFLFKLHEGQGFPLEFSLQYLDEKGISVDRQALKKLSLDHQQKSKGLT